MENASKIFKIKIDNDVIFVSIDSSFVAENIYNKDFYNVYNGEHYHAWHELFFADEKPILLYYKGKECKFLNSVLVIPPFAKHCTVRESGYRITFSYKLQKSKTKKCFFESMFSSKEPSCMASNSNITKYLKEIERLFFETNQYSEQMIESLIKLVFCEMALVNTDEENKRKFSVEESYLEKIENILFDFRLDMNLGTVAEKLGLSTKQVSRIIRKNYNSTFSRMLSERRLSIASSMLINTDMTIAEIVEYVNFPSESHFYLEFKNKYNVTPSEYRKNKSEEKFTTE